MRDSRGGAVFICEIVDARYESPHLKTRLADEADVNMFMINILSYPRLLDNVSG